MIYMCVHIYVNTYPHILYITLYLIGVTIIWFLHLMCICLVAAARSLAPGGAICLSLSHGALSQMGKENHN